MSIRVAEMLMALVCIGLRAPGVLAQCDQKWFAGDSAPGIVGEVHALTNWDPDGDGPRKGVFVAGGSFFVAGNVLAPYVTYWDGATWNPIGGRIEGANPVVRALAVFQGKLIAAGRFESAGGVPVRNIAQWDGNAWSALGEGVDDNVSALEVFRDELIAAGTIRDAGGLSVNNIARWNGAQWLELGMGVYTHPDGGGVTALGTFDDNLIVAGSFDRAGDLETGIRGIARWDGLDWYPLGQNPPRSVRAITTFQGALIVGGDFTTSPSSPPHIVARWDGTAWTRLAPNNAWPWDSGSVSELLVFEGDLYAGGSRDSGGSLGRLPTVSRWNGERWTIHGTGSGGGDYLWALGAYEGTLVVGGHFDNFAGLGVQGIAGWTAGAWHSLPDEPTFEPYQFGVYREDLIAFGYYPAHSNRLIANIARWDGNGWQPWIMGPDGLVRAAIEFKGDLIMGGDFYEADGLPVNRIARWDGVAWHPLGDGVHGAAIFYRDEVYSMIHYQGDLIVAGRFRFAGDVEVNSIARWNGQDWFPLGEGFLNIFEQPGDVYALAIYQGELIAGGWIAASGLQPINGMARWDGSSWMPLGPAAPTGDVYQLAVYDGELIAAVDPNSSANSSATAVYSWNGVDWRTLVRNTVESLSVYGGNLIVAGKFSVVNGVPAHAIVRWDGHSWHGLGANWPNITVQETMPFGRDLFLYGNFTGVVGQVAFRWTRWGPDSLFGDINGDELVNRVDAAAWADCATPPLPVDAPAGALPECLCIFNSDGDADVDLKDFALFARAPSSP